MRRLAAVLLAVFGIALCGPAMGQSVNTFPSPVISAAGFPLAGSVTSAGTFQQLAAQNQFRKGCEIQNTGAGTLYVYLGATGSATETASFQVPANGGMFYCSNTNGGSAIDAIQVTSNVTGNTFTAVFQ